jgi:hypothetical protein
MLVVLKKTDPIIMIFSIHRIEAKLEYRDSPISATILIFQISVPKN